MKVRLFAFLLVVGGLGPLPAAAQETNQTPAGIPVAGYATDRLERVLDFAEHNPVLQQIFSPRDGFGIRIGGIESGSGFATGPLWRSSQSFGGRLQLQASAAASIARDHEIEASAALPELGTHRVALAFDVSARHLARERFFGEGPHSRRADEAFFTTDRLAAGAEASLAAASWLHLSASARTAMFATATAAGAADGVAAATALSGDNGDRLLAQGLFAVLAFSATVDHRDVPGNPRRGGRYHIGIERHDDRALGRYSFNRVNVELAQHLSGWRRQRMLTLRAIASLSEPDAGNEVPFYLQPTLGGSRLLRGFAPDRFRDRNMLVLEAEYAWDIWPFLSAVLFYESGVVAPRWQEIALNDLRRDYGVGFRIGSARTIAVQTDVALGSGEGTRIAMRFGHAF